MRPPTVLARSRRGRFECGLRPRLDSALSTVTAAGRAFLFHIVYLRGRCYPPLTFFSRYLLRVFRSANHALHSGKCRKCQVRQTEVRNSVRLLAIAVNHIQFTFYSRQNCIRYRPIISGFSSGVSLGRAKKSILALICREVHGSFRIRCIYRGPNQNGPCWHP
jgi:hypothetical protein